MVTQQEMRPLPLYTGAALTYFAIIFLASSLVRAAAERWRQKVLRLMGNWERLVWNQRDLLLDGLAVTVEVCLIAFVAAIVGGLVLCLVRLYVRPLRPVAIALIEFFRATPIFVQLIWVSYVWPELFGWPDTFFTAGWLALALQSSGYLAETFRAGIEARAARPARGRRSPPACRRARFPPHRAAAGARSCVGAVDRQPVHRHREIVDAGVGDHRPGPDVPVAEARPHLVRADRDPDRDRGDLHPGRLRRLGARQALADLLRRRYGLAAS